MNIPNAGINDPDTMCGLGDIRNNFFNIFLIPNNIRNNFCVPNIIRNHFFNIFLIPNNIRNNFCVPNIIRNHFPILIASRRKKWLWKEFGLG